MDLYERAYQLQSKATGDHEAAEKLGKYLSANFHRLKPEIIEVAVSKLIGVATTRINRELDYAEYEERRSKRGTNPPQYASGSRRVAFQEVQLTLAAYRLRSGKLMINATVAEVLADAARREQYGRHTYETEQRRAAFQRGVAALFRKDTDLVGSKLDQWDKVAAKVGLGASEYDTAA